MRSILKQGDLFKREKEGGMGGGREKEKEGEMEFGKRRRGKGKAENIILRQKRINK